IRAADEALPDLEVGKPLVSIFRCGNLYRALGAGLWTGAGTHAGLCRCNAAGAAAASRFRPALGFCASDLRAQLADGRRRLDLRRRVGPRQSLGIARPAVGLSSRGPFPSARTAVASQHSVSHRGSDLLRFRRPPTGEGTSRPECWVLTTEE